MAYVINLIKAKMKSLHQNPSNIKKQERGWDSGLSHSSGNQETHKRVRWADLHKHQED